MDSLIALIIGLALGVAIFYLDLKKGPKWYRSWYNISHKDPLPEESKQGFIVNQIFSKRLAPAVFVSVLIAAIFYLSGNLNILVVLIYAIVIFVGIMVSFYLSPFLFKKLPGQLEKLNSTIDKIDKLESELQNKEASELPPKPMEPEKAEEKKQEPQDDKNDKDWRSGVQDFLDK